MLDFFQIQGFKLNIFTQVVDIETFGTYFWPLIDACKYKIKIHKFYM